MGRTSLGESDIESLAQILSRGFENLLIEVQTLSRREVALKNKLQSAYQEYNFLVSKPDHAYLTLEETGEISRNLGDADPVEEQMNGHYTDLEDVARSISNPTIQEAFEACKLVRGRTQLPTPPKTRVCPVTRQTTDQEDFAHDFTTPGKRGSLECPFAKTTQAGLSISGQTGNADPIAAEFHQEKTSVQSVTASAQAGGKCPIRFLDQHSPEEVAQYFENHKHEIPRSHEICVKRYQQNNESIRRLDAKYGNLVNMIQGLGVKHRQYLPANEEELDVHRESSSAEAVEKWAEDVSHHSGIPGSEHLRDEEGIGDDERVPHFEKSLREIRLGESPSRPWGISVPAAQEPAESAIIQSDKGIKPLSPFLRSPENGSRIIDKERPPASGAPHHHRSIENGARKNGLSGPPLADSKPPIPASVADTPPGKKSYSSSPSPLPLPHPLLPPPPPPTGPQMIFHGPVFFGYSPEQAMTMMQSGRLRPDGHHA